MDGVSLVSWRVNGEDFCILILSMISMSAIHPSSAHSPWALPSA
jgi:hypothetical protein